MITLIPGGSVSAGTPSVLSPYLGVVTSATFLRGAAIDLSAPLDFAQMHSVFRINTVNVYGLTSANVNWVQDAVAAQRMRIVARVEAYDPATFAFRRVDAEQVVAEHREMLNRLSPASTAYIVVNLPVDDPRVLSDPQRQVAYAHAVVPLVRRAAPGIPVFLSLFYGWDGSYRTPSYLSSGADGYVLTNYSYPPPGDVASADSPVDELLDTKRLEKALDRAAGAHPGKPIVVEYAFQTLTFQRGHRPAQTAGLVADQAAKAKALRDTTLFYTSRYPAVIGTMYFGYDLDKSEGTPPHLLDFGLVRRSGY